MISFDFFPQALQPSMNFKISEIGLCQMVRLEPIRGYIIRGLGKNKFLPRPNHPCPSPPQKTNGWPLKSTDTFQCKIIPQCIVLIFFPKMAGSGNSFKMVSLIPFLKPLSNLVCRVLVPSRDLSWNFA